MILRKLLPFIDFVTCGIFAQYLVVNVGLEDEAPGGKASLLYINKDKGIYRLCSQNVNMDKKKCIN